MRDLPENFNSEIELENFMATPSEGLVNYFSQLEGDIMILGASGKMGPTIALMAKKAIELSGVQRKVYAVARSKMPALEEVGIETLNCDLLDIEAVKKLPKVKNVVYLVGRKFGSTGNESLTWAINTIVPSNIGRVFTDCNIVSLSTGCVYPVVEISTGGSVESDLPGPIGEYAMSCLGRERAFDYYAGINNFKIIHVRLNYSLDLRYGVMVDIASKVFNDKEIDITTGYFNGIWQGDACDYILRCFDLAGKSGTAINITGPETLSVRWVAGEFGKYLGRKPIFVGEENGKAYLSNATKANSMFGNPSVPVGKLIEWIAEWMKSGGVSLNKPTHFEVQSGKY